MLELKSYKHVNYGTGLNRLQVEIVLTAEPGINDTLGEIDRKAKEEALVPLEALFESWQQSDPARKAERLASDLAAAEAERKGILEQCRKLELAVGEALERGDNPQAHEADLVAATVRADVLNRRAEQLRKLATESKTQAIRDLELMLKPKLRELAAAARVEYSEHLALLQDSINAVILGGLQAAGTVDRMWGHQGFGEGTGVSNLADRYIERGRSAVGLQAPPPAPPKPLPPRPARLTEFNMGGGSF